MEKLLNSNPDSYLENESEFQSLLSDEKSWRQIPLINYSKTHELKDLSLVRFRGMIQDMLDPEFYMAQYEVLCNTNNDSDSKRLQNGKYRDCLAIQPKESVNYDSELLQRDERRTLFVISIPGLNNWVADIEITSTPKLTSIINSKTEEGSGQKRYLEDDEFMEIDSTEAGCSNNNSQETKNNKKFKIVKNNDTISRNNKVLSNEYLLNSPIPERPSSACMVKIYSDLDSYQLNSILDVVGYLSLDPALDGTLEDPSDFEDINEIQATNPPPSLIPRLHAIAVRKLKHSNPLVDESLTNFQISSFNFESIYNDLKVILIQALFGDNLAAEYLLCHLISTVYVRTNSETLGQFSLNLCNIPSEVLPKYTNDLYEIIESLLPASHYLPMSLETMNERTFVPTKDYDTNRLTAGLLQLAPTTHLILDETRLQPGKLENNGIAAVQHLAKIIKSQEIKYNFKFYEIDFDTNIPVLVLSEGRSLLPSNFQVPLKADSDCVKLIEATLKAAKHFLLPKINLIRTYLTKAKLSEFAMNTDVTKIIENDFVEMRKMNNKIGPDELHSLLVLSRLLGISQGKTELDHDCWKKAKEMENERNMRLNELPKSKNTTRN